MAQQTETPRSWERQEGEGEAPWTQFRAYLASDRPRNLERLARELGLSYGQVRNVSSEWRWADRVAAWEAEVGKAEDEVTLEEIRRRRREYLQDLDAMRREVRNRLGEIPPGALGRLGIDAIRLQHLLTGGATERLETTGGGEGPADDYDWEQLTDDEQWQLRALLAKARRD